MSKPQGARRRLTRSTIAGAVLLLIGVCMLVYMLLPTTDGGGTVAIALEVAQHALLWGDRQLSDSQVRFNAVVVTVFMEEVIGGSGTPLGELLESLRGVLRHATSTLGLLTLLALIAMRVLMANELDRRFPGVDRDRPPTG